jgi:hypothetical protein
MAVMVMQVFIRKNTGWLFAAIGYHALIDGVAVIGQKYLLPAGLEGVIGIFAFLSVAIIFLLRQPEPGEVIRGAAPALVAREREPVAETMENLENTRYQ